MSDDRDCGSEQKTSGGGGGPATAFQIGILIITADGQMVDLNGSTPEQLAKMWADSLRPAIPKAQAQG